MLKNFFVIFYLEAILSQFCNAFLSRQLLGSVEKIGGRFFSSSTHLAPKLLFLPARSLFLQASVYFSRTTLSDFRLVFLDLAGIQKLLGEADAPPPSFQQLCMCLFTTSDTNNSNDA